MDLTEQWHAMELKMDAAIHPLLTIILTTIILVGFSIAYYIQNKNVRPSDEPKKFSMLVENAILMVKSLVVETFGVKYAKWTPFFLFIFGFVAISNIIAAIGFKEASVSYTVPLTLGFTVWLLSIFMGIRIQKWMYLMKFTFSLKIKGKKIPIMINPLEFMGLISPLISISFRLWGNILAGFIIYEVIFWALSNAGSSPAISIILAGGVLLMPFLIIYFSFFTGLVQAYVFTLLSVTYISAPIAEHEQELEEAREVQVASSLQTKKK